MANVTFDTLYQVLRYEPDTGYLYWLARSPDMFFNLKPEAYCKTWNKRYAGAQALTANSNGYRMGSVMGINAYAHRVAWMLGHGMEIPDGQIIDHVNGQKHDNRLLNLRLATLSLNAANMKPRQNGKPKGVSVGRWGVGWQANINKGGKKMYLGCFNTQDAAQDAYEKAAEAIYGEYAYHKGAQQ